MTKENEYKTQQNQQTQFSLNIPGFESGLPTVCPVCENTVSNAELLFEEGKTNLSPEGAKGCIRCSKKCQNCDDIKLISELLPTRSGWACSECSTICDYCNETCLDEDLVTYRRGGRSTIIGCNNCVKNCFECDKKCNEEDMKEDIDSRRKRLYCEDCWGEKFCICDNCGDSVKIDDSVYIESESCNVCTYCYERNYSTCSECDTIIPDSDTVIVQNITYCSDCAPNEIGEGEIHTFNEFSYTSKDKFLQNLIKLVPITVRELEDKHPRLANGLPDLIQAAGGKRSKGLITSELINSYRNELNPENFPIRFTEWGSTLQRSFKGNIAPQMVMVILGNELFFNEMSPLQKDLFESINMQSHQDTHPIVKNGIGWARLELNKDDKYILVDEIQSDHSGRAYKLLTNNGDYINRNIKNHLISKYKISEQDFENEIKDYAELFKDFPDIAVQAITNYARANGYKKLYWHTYESGKKLKNNSPPVELYSKVPKEHSFRKSNEKPFNLEGLFFEREAKKIYLLFKTAKKILLKYRNN